jgi:hypothetical protein
MLRSYQHMSHQRGRFVKNGRSNRLFQRLTSNWPLLACIALVVLVGLQIYNFVIAPATGGDRNDKDLHFSTNLMSSMTSGGRGTTKMKVGALKFRDSIVLHLPKFSGNTHSFAGIPKETTRVAMLCPYIGTALPPWFDSFAYSAQSSASLFDWIVIVLENIPIRHLPPNVKLIQISSEDILNRIASLEGEGGSAGLPSSVRDSLLSHMPKLTVELKPALGYLFEDLLTANDYSHWGYADMDQLVGRVERLFSREKLSKHDVLTSSYGDNYRLYMRGQLTIYRNTHQINRLWRECMHLRDFNRRLRDFAKSGYAEWGFQSAEGCFSRVVLDTPGLRFLSMPNQLSDAYGAQPKDKESLLVGTALARCYVNQMLHESGGVRGMEGLKQVDAFLTRGDEEEEERGRDKVRTGAGTGTPLPAATSLSREHYDCAYWIRREGAPSVPVLSACRRGDLRYRRRHILPWWRERGPLQMPRWQLPRGRGESFPGVEEALLRAHHSPASGAGFLYAHLAAWLCAIALPPGQHPSS